MVIYLVGIGAFILGANLGVLIALLLLHGRAESLARNYRAEASAPAEAKCEEPLTPAYF